MKISIFFKLFILLTVLHSCHTPSQYLQKKQLGLLKDITVENQWVEYDRNPVIKCTPGSFDAGALGNMSVVLV